MWCAACDRKRTFSWLKIERLLICGPYATASVHAVFPAVNKKSSSAVLNDNTIQLVISDNLSKEEQNNHISTLISRCIGSKRLPKLQVKIKELNKKHFNQSINKIFFKHNKSNWGSCSRAGNINISTRLLFAPDDVLEYVCIHELAHLLEHNHSKKFWTLVETAMPEYKKKERWLKENGDICKF